MSQWLDKASPLDLRDDIVEHRYELRYGSRGFWTHRAEESGGPPACDPIIQGRDQELRDLPGDMPHVFVRPVTRRPRSVLREDAKLMIGSMRLEAPLEPRFAQSTRIDAAE